MYFQPLKTILREGGPDFNVPSSLICMKEVFRGCCPANNHDPIDMLLKAGIPAENITWIAMLRDPVQNYASWTQHIVGSTPEDYEAAQTYTVDIYNRYKQQGVNITPFAYDLLKLGEERVLGALFKKAGIDALANGLEFNTEAINAKMNYGQAADPSYFNMSIKPTLERKKFVYTTNTTSLPAVARRRIIDICQVRYEDFYSLSKRELNL